MLKRFFVFLALILMFTFSVSPKVSQAEELSQPPVDLSEDVYDQFVEEGIIDSSISYETWTSINTEDSFDEFNSGIPVPNVLMEVEPDSSKTKGFSILSQSSSDFGSSSTSGPTLKKGDILVSNGTSSFGLTGHAGIAISSTQVLHISGKGAKPLVITSKQWQDRYGIVRGQIEGNNTHTKVYRVGSTTNATKAADWAITNYKGKSYDYGITTALLSKDPTYCSKIVWQAYNYIGGVDTPSSKIATPYGLPGYFKSAQNLKGMGIL